MLNLWQETEEFTEYKVGIWTRLLQEEIWNQSKCYLQRR